MLLPLYVMPFTLLQAGALLSGFAALVRLCHGT